MTCPRNRHIPETCRRFGSFIDISGARLGIGALAALLFVAAQAREIDPARFSGSDTERVQKAADAWAKEPGSVLRLDKRQWRLNATIVIAPPDGQDRVSGSLIGARYWLAIQWDGPAGQPAFEFRNAKDVSLRGISIRGAGLAFRTASSSSRLSLSECRVEGTGVGAGYLFAAEGNGDISVLSLRDCEAVGFDVGFQWVGPNNLDPYVSHCVASECGTGFDLREGGSNAVLYGVGGTRTLVLVRVNGGYQIDVLVQSAEHCGTVFRTGGDDAAGYGQTVPQTFRALSVRDCTGPWAVVNKAGVVDLRADSVKGPNTVTYQNRSSTETLELRLEGAAVKASVSGTGNVLQVGK